MVLKNIYAQLDKYFNILKKLSTLINTSYSEDQQQHVTCTYLKVHVYVVGLLGDNDK